MGSIRSRSELPQVLQVPNLKLCRWTDCGCALVREWPHLSELSQVWFEPTSIVLLKSMWEHTPCENTEPPQEWQLTHLKIVLRGSLWERTPCAKVRAAHCDICASIESVYQAAV